MRLYNPFKPHLVQFNTGKYGVRKLTLFDGWAFYDNSTILVYSIIEAEGFCTFNNIEIAKDILHRLNNKLKVVKCLAGE